MILQKNVCSFFRNKATSGFYSVLQEIGELAIKTHFRLFFFSKFKKFLKAY